MDSSAPAITPLCDTTTFGTPSLFGGEIVSIEANLITGYSNYILDGYLYSQPTPVVENATFCNVTVTYTHPGQNDTINVEAWLPAPEHYNGRLQAAGGGGWSPGRGIISYWGMAGAVVNGYATVSTDAGVPDGGGPDAWVLRSPGNLDFQGLSNFGHVAYNDAAILAKQLIKSYYGQPPAYSYWNACSQGGRQAMSLAQQYPDAFDGIIAAAPAMNWAHFVMSSIWPAFYMLHTGQFPRMCEFDYITTKAISQCDELDGVQDGLISDPEACLNVFNVTEHVGQTFVCDDATNNSTTSIALSAAAADVAKAIWQGPTTSNGHFIWYGYDIGASLSVIAPTSCNTQGECSAPIGVATIASWWRNFVDLDPRSNRTSFSWEDFDTLYRQMKLNNAQLETGEKDLSAFRNAGGKMITYHGLADDSIPSWNSLSYYRNVTEYLGRADDFYKYYRVPGLGHCATGPGGQPVELFGQLRAWVENGTAPSSTTVTVNRDSKHGFAARDEILCPYPEKAVFNADGCGNSTSASCWSCK